MNFYCFFFNYCCDHYVEHLYLIIIFDDDQQLWLNSYFIFIVFNTITFIELNSCFLDVFFTLKVITINYNFIFK